MLSPLALTLALVTLAPAADTPRYNVLWIDQVAMSADQLDLNVIPGAGRQISTDGAVFLNGVNVGLEGRW